MAFSGSDDGWKPDHARDLDLEEKTALLLTTDEGVETGNKTSVPPVLKRSPRKCRRILCRAFMTLVFAGVIIWNFAPFPNAQPSEPTTQPAPSVSRAICKSPECIHAASEILFNLDSNYEKIDPCTDFDQYVCGGWRERHDMRSDQGSVFAGTMMAEAAQTRLRHILERSEAPESADATVYAANDEATARTEDNLTDAILFLLKKGVEALASPGVSADDRDPDNVAVFINPPGNIGLPAREYYNNTETVAKYTGVVKQILQAFKVSDFEKIAENVVAFEKELADATPDTQTQEDVTKSYNPLSVKDTQLLVPQISFEGILSELSPDNYTSDRLIVGSPSYLKALSKILKHAPRQTVSFFFQWKIIQAFAGSIEDDEIVPLTRFTNELAGKDPQAKEERWRKCIRSLDEGLGWTLSRFYVLDSFSEESKKLGDQVVSDIKERFAFTLDQTAWMSPDVRKLGIQKVENIVQKIGFPTTSPNVLDPRDVEKYYEALEVSKKTFFENEVAVAKFDLAHEWSKLGKPTNRDEWDMTAATPPTFYGATAPLYLAYGSFGAISGHELSHAFDSTGRHYDETGNYTNWWDDETVQAFEERAQCFVDQYSKFTVEGPGGKMLHVNGRLTLGENIADAGGLTASFHAWKKHDDAKADLYLPGLDAFTKEQLFFVSYANWWCGKSTKEAAEQAIYNDPHAPKSARIIDTMANSREFKEAFQCPEKKPVCQLW
ncbi:hypothetical protein N7454_009909 [Penicillium verhagenii]|nr:hypothetical protein N7454_009909 [Penicillium verhagenii]